MHALSLPPHAPPSSPSHICDTTLHFANLSILAIPLSLFHHLVPLCVYIYLYILHNCYMTSCLNNIVCSISDRCFRQTLLTRQQNSLSRLDRTEWQPPSILAKFLISFVPNLNNLRAAPRPPVRQSTLIMDRPVNVPPHTVPSACSPPFSRSLRALYPSMLRSSLHPSLSPRRIHPCYSGYFVVCFFLQSHSYHANLIYSFLYCYKNGRLCGRHYSFIYIHLHNRYVI